MRCAVCGAGIEARSRSHGKHRRVFYGCPAYHRKGRSVCTNSLTVPMEIADEAVLSALETGLLHPSVIKTAVERTVDRLCKGSPTNAAGTRRELRKVDRELETLTTAVAAGGDVPALVSALCDREARRRALLEQLDPRSPMPTRDSRAVLKDLQARLKDRRELLRNLPRRRVAF
jgi:Recombinase zinc beta ribbon domain